MLIFMRTRPRKSEKRFAGLLGESDRKYKCKIQRFDSRIFRFAQFPFKADTKHCGAIALEKAELILMCFRIYSSKVLDTVTKQAFNS